MLFRLKKRCGSHRQDGKTYTAGDTIKTTIDLIALFPSKFERVYKEELSDTESDESKLRKPKIPPSVDADDVNKEGEDYIDDDASTPSKELTEKYGEDVTSEFSTAEKVGVKVFEKKNWYAVIDETDGELLNEKKLRKKDVKSFLTQYLNDENTNNDEGTDED